MSIVFTLIQTFEICGIERARNVTIKLCSVWRQNYMEQIPLWNCNSD